MSVVLKMYFFVFRSYGFVTFNTTKARDDLIEKVSLYLFFVS